MVFLFFVLLGVIAFDYVGRVESCERVNVLRTVVAGFIGDAEQARRSAGDAAVADRYRGWLEHLEAVEQTPPGEVTVECEIASLPW